MSDQPELASYAPEETPPVRPRRSRRLWGWLVGMVLIGVVFGLCIVAILRFVDGPVQASGRTLNQAKAKASPSPARAPINTLGGSQVELSYPAIFDAVAQVKTDPQAYEQYTIGSKENYRHQITVNVRPLPSGALEDDASYRLRQNSSIEYSPEPERFGGESVIIMTKADHAEQTLFWPHHGKLLTISVTSGDPRDDVGAILRETAKSVRWLQ